MNYDQGQEAHLPMSKDIYLTATAYGVRLIKPITPTGGFMDLFKNHSVRTIAIYLLAFICVALTIIIINPGQDQGGWTTNREILAIGIIGLVLTPIAILAHRWRALLEQTEVYHLKEYELSEEELKEAVKLWVFTQKGQTTEGDTQLTINDEGQVVCRYYLTQR